MIFTHFLKNQWIIDPEFEGRTWVVRSVAGEGKGPSIFDFSIAPGKNNPSKILSITKKSMSTNNIAYLRTTES